MVGRGGPAALVLLVAAAARTLLLLPASSLLPVCAAEEAAAEAAEAAEAEAEGVPAADGEGVLDSARELKDKLGQLKALLAERSGEASEGSEDLQKHLAGLEKQLEDMGLGELDLAGEMPTPELTAFLGGCVTMTVRRAGLKRPTTMGALRRLADEKFTQEEAKDIELLRMIAVCINDMTDVELDQYKSGTLTQLPKKMAETAAKAESKSYLDAVDKGMWKQLREVAKGLVKEFGGGAEEELKGGSSRIGILAMCIIIGSLAFLTKKVLDMQSSQQASSKKEKKGKKQK